ncbi:MAG: diacylglycerol kinase family lipid kinase [Paludibacteraceae bacterium]|nr:diacylglycerol kinase family lipid kinase [Paludibacteraceae bacterium]
MSNPIVIIFNPCSGGKDSSVKSHLLQCFAEAELDVRLLETEYSGHAVDLARVAADEGARCFVSVGGDGTVSEMVNGLMRSSVDTKTLSFGVIPAGTGNDWCRYFKIPTDMQQAVDIIKKQKTMPIDVGRMCSDADGEQNCRFFVNSVGFGFDAEVVEKKERMSCFGGKKWSYLVALAASVLKHRSVPMTLKMDSDQLESPIYTMSVANGPFTGGGIKQTPLAVPDDGFFDVMLATNLSPFGLIKGLWAIFRQKGESSGIIKTFKTKGMHIHSERKPKIEADGILQSEVQMPVHITMAPLALNMIIP